MRIEQLKLIFDAWDEEYGISVDDTDFYLGWRNINLRRVANIHGDNCRIRVKCGATVDLESLEDNQFVVVGDGATYYFLLTEIEN